MVVYLDKYCMLPIHPVTTVSGLTIQHPLHCIKSWKTLPCVNNMANFMITDHPQWQLGGWLTYVTMLVTYAVVTARWWGSSTSGDWCLLYRLGHKCTC